MATELEQINKRIRRRAEDERRDRERQRILVRERIASGHSWSQVIAEAGVSRTTLRAILQRDR